MKIERYTSVLVVLAVGLFLVNASWPEATFAEAQASTCPACVQCSAPVNTWCVPATAGSGVSGTFCATSVPPARAAVVKAADTPWGVLGSILEFPFVVGQCLIGGCP